MKAAIHRKCINGNVKRGDGRFICRSNYTCQQNLTFCFVPQTSYANLAVRFMLNSDIYIYIYIYIYIQNVSIRHGIKGTEKFNVKIVLYVLIKQAENLL